MNENKTVCNKPHKKKCKNKCQNQIQQNADFQRFVLLEMNICSFAIPKGRITCLSAGRDAPPYFPPIPYSNKNMSEKLNPKLAILQLEDFGFQKTTDHIAEYSTKADLFYLKIDIERYIVFHHFNKSKTEDLQHFDCWIGTYKFTEFIGKIPAIEREEIKLDFDFKEDWKLLAGEIGKNMI